MGAVTERSERFHGVFPYLVTPLNADETIDTGALTALVERVVAAGVHGVVALGSSGEFPFLNAAQRAAVLATTVTAAAGRVPVIGGAGGFASADAIVQARRAEEFGCDAVLCVQQGYGPTTADDSVRFVAAMADSADVPVVVYHNPQVCHVQFGQATLQRLAALDNVVGIKDASGNINTFHLSGALRTHGVGLFAATAASPTAAMLLGAAGWMAGPACVFPAELVRWYDMCAAGDWGRAAAVERCLNEFLERFREVGPAAAVKGLLRADGADCGRTFQPAGAIEATSAMTDSIRAVRATIDAI